MREVMSLTKLEATDGEVRILANSGELALVFPCSLRENVEPVTALSGAGNHGKEG
jgi:hypothetical protein